MPDDSVDQSEHSIKNVEKNPQEMNLQELWDTVKRLNI